MSTSIRAGIRALGTLCCAALLLAAPPVGRAVAEAPRVAVIHPEGKPSDKLKTRWQTLSQKTLLHLLRCLEHLTARQAERAVDACSSAIALEPTNPGAYKLRGEAYLMLDRLPSALADFDRSIRLDASDPESYAGRADTLRTMRQFPAALADYSKALSLAPRDARLWNARCWAHAVSGLDLSRGHTDCDRAIALNPRFAQAFDSRGLVHLKQNRLTDAVHDYDRALTLLPGYALALFGRAVAEQRLGMKAAGRRDFAEARRHDGAIDAKFSSYGVVVGGRASKSLCGSSPCLKLPPTMTPKRNPFKAEPPGEPTRSASR
jgi:tetratricopeptide (TPR) repeat protein